MFGWLLFIGLTVLLVTLQTPGRHLVDAACYLAFIYIHICISDITRLNKMPHYNVIFMFNVSDYLIDGYEIL